MDTGRRDFWENQKIKKSPVHRNEGLREPG